MYPPKGWKLFCEKYTGNNAYWYIPKGLSIKEDNVPLIYERFKILKNYEGQIWAQCQFDFVKELEKNGLFEKKAGRQMKKDRAAIGRVFKVICTSLGLAWVNEKEKVSITPIGNLFLKNEGKKFQIIQKQIDKFQFYNPSFHNKDFKSIRVNPVYFLTSVLLNLRDNYLTKDEYILFVAKQQSNDDIENAVELIENFRMLPESSQKQLINYLNNIKIDTSNPKRTSILNTIRLESPYALQFWGCSTFLNYNNFLSIKNKSQAKSFVKDFNKNGVWIDFSKEKDWMLYYGQETNKTSSEYAKDYYVDVSDVEAGLSLISEKKRRGLKVKIDEEKYKSILIDEKLLEDFLEKHLDELEPGLKLIKRQKDTLVGRIDLFAKDKNGYCVVIELKKGRTADKVLGQTLRYVGFIQENEAGCNKVRAIIVGKNIDNKLKYAVKTVKVKCNLYEFDFSVKFEKVFPSTSPHLY